MSNRTSRQAIELLQEEAGIALPPEAQEQLDEYAALLRRWNSALNLVSAGDLSVIETVHWVDAFSLAPYVQQFTADGGSVLDIGTGGGLPIIPIKCLFPDLPCTLIERSTRKVGFLHRVVANLNLSGMEIIHGSFPEVMDKITASVITARAVERPAKVAPAILSRMTASCAFLCQFAPGQWTVPKTFHVEHVDDSWTQTGLRRGELKIITRQHF